MVLEIGAVCVLRTPSGNRLISGIVQRSVILVLLASSDRVHSAGSVTQMLSAVGCEVDRRSVAKALHNLETVRVLTGESGAITLFILNHALDLRGSTDLLRDSVLKINGGHRSMLLDTLVSSASATLTKSLSPGNQGINASLAAQEGEVRAISVFLCHGSQDKISVRRIYELLIKEGFSPWLDEKNLFPGDEWEPTIRQAVREADCVLVCLSKATTTKTGFVQKEIRYALDVADEKPPGSLYIVPLKLEECEIPERLSRWQWCDSIADPELTALISALRRVKALHDAVQRDLA